MPFEELVDTHSDDIDFAPEDELDGAPAVDAEAAGRAVNALASAWSTFRLYPNPIDQPGFQQAIGNLKEATGPRLTLEVGAGSLGVGDVAVRADRDTVEQLATRFYIHDVELFTIGNDIDSKELVLVFGLLVLDRSDAEDLGGVEGLANTLKTIGISTRGLLSRDPDEEGGDGDGEDGEAPRKTELAKLIDEGATADEVHDRLMDISRGDDDRIRLEFVRGFREVHADAMTSTSSASLGDMLLPYVVNDIGPSPTGTFIDVFFRLPVKTRSEILEAFLISTTQDESRMFLDQFSGDELAEMVSSISEEGYQALLEYGQATTEVNAYGDELLQLLTSARQVREWRVDTAARIAELVATIEVAPSETIGDEVRELLSEDQVAQYSARVSRGLFATVTEDSRFVRLAEVWVGRIRDLVYRGEIEESIAMLRAILDDPPFPAGRAPVVDNALAELVSPELIKAATSRSVAGRSELVIEFLRILGSPALRRVTELLVAEEDGAARRHLIDLLANLATEDASPILASLSDERWFVVRNMVVILAKTGLANAIEPVRQAVAHPDARVRVEALRGLVALDNLEAAPTVVSALGDPEKRVRDSAVTLLRALESGAIEDRLLTTLREGATDGDTLHRIAQYLVDVAPDTVDEVKTLAGRKFAFKAAQRASRAAAKQALRSRDDG